MTLDEFLQELSARRGLHRKIGLLTRYWRQVQRLPADKQQQVALALGSKAAWNGLEKLAASRLRRRHARQGRSRSAAGANQGVGC